MNVTETTGIPLQDLLASLADSAAGEYSCIRARSEHGLKSVHVDGLQLAVLVSGRKTIESLAQTVQAAPGELLVLKPGHLLDVINVPDAQSRQYLTLSIPVCEEVIQAAQLIWSAPVGEPRAAVAKFDLAEVQEDMLDWALAIRRDDGTAARQAMVNLVLNVCRSGHADILRKPEPTLATRIRDWVRAQPERDWQSRDFEERLHVSGPTLRRRLNAERTTLREIIQSTRLAVALDCLYTTRLPLAQTARRAGFSSTRLFVERFTERYGVAPEAIRS